VFFHPEKFPKKTPANCFAFQTIASEAKNNAKKESGDSVE